MNSSLIDIIVECSNDKAASMRANFITNKKKINTFIGVTILIGICKERGEPVRSIWSESESRESNLK